MKTLLVVVVLALLAGCAIAPPKYLNQSVAMSSPGTHVVTVERGKWLGAAHAPMTLFVDGEPTAVVYGGQAINLHLPDGRHIIGVRMNAQAGERPEREIAVDVSAESQPILRAGPVAAGYGGWGIKVADK